MTPGRDIEAAAGQLVEPTVPVPAAGTALRLAVVTETYPPEINGVAHTVQHMVDGMRERGHDIQLIRPRQGRDDRGWRERGLQVRPQPGAPIPGYANLRFGFPVRRRIRHAWHAFEPDAVYIATEGPLGGAALAAARSLGLPVVAGFHTNFDRYSRYYGVGFLEPVIHGFLRRFHNRAQVTLVPTAELKRQLEAMGFDHCRVLSRGVDTALFNPHRRDQTLRTAWRASADGPVVLYVGRLAPEKNLDLAVRAFRAMQARRPEARFVLVGDGPATPELRRLNPDFVFAGMRRGVDLAAHYASADVFLFPSTTETFGNVVIEAMASGLAVVAFAYAAPGEHIRHEETGLLAPLRDADSFMRLATRLADSPARCHDLGTAARRRAEALDWQAIYQELEALFEELSRASKHHASDEPLR